MENLRRIREKRHKNQLNVALAVGVTQESISMYESGIGYPSATILIKLAKYLETSTDYLLGLTDDDTPIKFMNRNLNDKEKELLDKFIYLATEDQLKLIGYADSLNSKVTN
jgi:transcriptional regulator with XRE-family HTH domain